MRMNNALKFYYVQTVLGVSSVIQPKAFRSVYRLLNSSKEGGADFLFFLSPVKSAEEKVLVQKIAKAIGASKELILEILNFPGDSIKGVKKETEVAEARAEAEKETDATARKLKSFNVKSVLDNLLTRFLPKGFIIFGEDLSYYLLKKNTFYSKAIEMKSFRVSSARGSFFKSEPLEPLKNFSKKDELKNISKSEPLGFLKNQTFKISRKVSISETETVSIPGLVLNPLSDFIGKDSKKVQIIKQQAWAILQQAFPK